MTSIAFSTPGTHQEGLSRPDGWSRMRVSQIIERHFCGPSPDCEERNIVSSREWGVLKTTAITWAGWNERGHKVLPSSYWGRSELEVRFGDVLVTKAGPRDRVGVVVYVNSKPQHLIVSGKMIGLRIHTEKVLPQILAGILSLRDVQNYIHARTTGMAESQVNFANDVLLETEVSVPPMREQIRIASVLNTVDESIAKTLATIAKLKQIRVGLLHDLLTCGLTGIGQLRDPIAHPEQFKDSPLGRIPVEWETKTALELSTQITDGEHQTPARSSEGIYLLSARNILDGELSLGDVDHISEEEYQRISRRCRPELGDLLMSCSGTIGRACLVPQSFRCALVRSVAIIKLRQDIVLPGFMELSCHSPIIQRQIASRQRQLAQANLFQSEIRSIEFPLPSLKEQELIAANMTMFDEMQKCEQNEMTKLSSLKSGLMSDLLTGRVRVPESTVTEAS